MKIEERKRAIEMRKSGALFSVIQKELNVSKSSLSIWLRDLELSSYSRSELLRGRELARLKAHEAKRLAKSKRINELQGIGFDEFIRYSSNSLFLVGLALYWAEGDKHKGERVKFTNSDPEMISLMMRWFREICEVPEHKFRIALHIHNLHSLKDCRDYWSQITGVPVSQFQKTYVKKSSLGQRRNILYAGTCGVVVSSKDLFRKIQGWRSGLLDYFKVIANNS